MLVAMRLVNETAVVAKSVVLSRSMEFATSALCVVIGSLLYYLGLAGIAKENICDDYCCNDSCKVGKQSAGKCMACLLYSNAAKIDSKDVESGIGCALENTCEAPGKGVCAIVVHCIDHHAARTAAAKWFHYCSRQGSGKIAVCSEHTRNACNAVHDDIHSARCAEHGYGNQYGNQVWNDAHGCTESLFCSLNECVIYIYLCAHSGNDEQYYYGEQYDTGK